MSKKIFTVGHSTHDVETFIKLLEANSINCVVDVRSTPYSQFASQFNENEIKFELNKRGITYIYMGEEFGARRDDDNLYINGKLSFDRTTKSPLFKKGVTRINNGLEKGFTIALMCSEKRPAECHRCIMIGKSLSDNGYEVEHILEDSTTITQQAVDTVLVEEYFPNRDQISLFNHENKSYDKYVADAYALRENEIAYNKNLTKEGGEL